MGEPAPARFAGVAGPHDSSHRSVNSGGVEQEAKKRPEVLRLMTHPGVGPITALAFVLIIRNPQERFPCGKQIGSYIGLIPAGRFQRGPATLSDTSAKQGNALLRNIAGRSSTGSGAL